jgi:hypothetical protein
MTSTADRTSPIRSPRTAPQFWYLGGRARVLLSGADTGGLMSVLELW